MFYHFVIIVIVIVVDVVIVVVCVGYGRVTLFDIRPLLASYLLNIMKVYRFSCWLDSPVWIRILYFLASITIGIVTNNGINMMRIHILITYLFLITRISSLYDITHYIILNILIRVRVIGVSS